jgi:hypothetical protein
VTIESASYPTDLDADLPLDADLIREGAGQIRLIKSVLETAFPTASEPLMATIANLNKVGTTQAQTSNDTSVASTAFVATAVLNAALDPATVPAQSGKNRKFLFTDGSTATWEYAGITYDGRTSNAILAQADADKLVDITSGTFTQTFTAAATLGNKWSLYIRNSGTGAITLNPDGAELIDGLSSYVMYPGECRLVQCTGTAFTTVVVSPFFFTGTASGDFIDPPGYRRLAGEMWAGGGSGRRHTTASVKCGGGGGAYAPFSYTPTAGATSAYTIGAGGAAVTADNTNGNAGGNTTFKTWTVYGGTAGTAAATSLGGNSLISTVTAGQQTLAASDGSTTDSTLYGGGTSVNDATFGTTIYGGSAGGFLTAGDAVVAPCGTQFGGAGGAASVASNGTDGTAPGGGGGPTKTGTSSGAGARGEIRIWGIA